MVKGNRILKKLGKEKFCKWLLNNGHKVKIDLTGADLRDANLRYANLRYANLQGANLQCVDLQDADLDFSSGIPFHCGGTRIKVDDRIIAQIVFHLTRQNTDGCSGGVKEAIEHIKEMTISDLFCEYRTELKRIKD